MIIFRLQDSRENDHGRGKKVARVDLIQRKEDGARKTITKNDEESLAKKSESEEDLVLETGKKNLIRFEI